MDYKTTIENLEKKLNKFEITYNHLDYDESKVEDYLVKKCKKTGFLCIKLNSSSASGLPDRMILGYGLTIFIELKIKGKEPRPLQKEMIKKIRQRGILCLYIDSISKIDFLFDKLLKDIVNTYKFKDKRKEQKNLNKMFINLENK